MRRSRNVSRGVSGGSSYDLISTLERFVYDTPLDEGERVIFDEIELNIYAVESTEILEKTALHKVLHDLAYVEFYLFSYDDLDWISDISDFAEYARDMFKDMNLTIPKEFYSNSEDTLYAARDEYRTYYLSGLNHIVESAFAHLWHRKSFLLDFNLLLADEVLELKESDYPQMQSDGKIVRAAYFPVWVKNVIMHREHGLCHYCNGLVASSSLPNQEYDIDHMVPIAKGGTNDPTNLVLSCAKCNNKKRARIQRVPDEFSWPTIHP
ncbi:HNH endonuclease [Vibrio crassostreae]|uniref:HNH endonuclease n=1 Tax=Vibrio crassostreae TaxID=246167 RepID=UPI00148CB73A|nr:HNH endonuclease [Vibrio crassostreae]NOI53489.1 HNH endonuclease [Vibrio crassostreae]